MKVLIVPASAVLLVGLAHAVWADAPREAMGEELEGQEPKLVGAWRGQTGCAGNFLFRADGTYEGTDYGPAGHDSAGAWKVRWGAGSATLVLTCKTSQDPDEVGMTTEIKVIQLDDGSLTVRPASETDLARYARVKR